MLLMEPGTYSMSRLPCDLLPSIGEQGRPPPPVSLPDILPDLPHVAWPREDDEKTAEGRSDEEHSTADGTPFGTPQFANRQCRYLLQLLLL